MSFPQTKIILITGGVRSGKSSFAQSLASHYERQVRYLATAEAKDEEMRRRIVHHQKNRPTSWNVIEEPIWIDQYFAPNEKASADTVTLLDCVTVWISNLLLQKDSMGKEMWESKQGVKIVEEQIDRFIQTLMKTNQPTILVTNEVGFGGIEMNVLGRIYQDLLGWTNQKLAKVADQVYLVVAGIPMLIKDDEKGVMKKLGD
ncbi:bifunctional adenosylcobinamide kinase/adenosylcobinamide-phosphate guanylyltransferase [Tepidibacillus marianensis]|uniref:bifunctional adenosylcobinamide kinase/adenosylcobinamide-phosphate guanylyltransferase n=1 Tax=Tepidibacillus marianensis TaxID=3131995 RepID=UPI0030D1838D